MCQVDAVWADWMETKPKPQIHDAAEKAAAALSGEAKEIARLRHLLRLVADEPSIDKARAIAGHELLQTDVVVSKQLTEDQIRDCARGCYTYGFDRTKFVRAIEAAHGIRGA